MEAKAGSSLQIRRERANIAQESSDDELIPPVPRGTLAGRSLVPELGPNWKNEEGGNQDRTCPNPNTTRREGGTLPEPEPQRQKLD